MASRKNNQILTQINDNELQVIYQNIIQSNDSEINDDKLIRHQKLIKTRLPNNQSKICLFIYLILYNILKDQIRVAQKPLLL